MQDSIHIEGLEGIGYDQSVEYEWLPPKCSKCEVFGHSITQCPKRGGDQKPKFKKQFKEHDGVRKTMQWKAKQGGANEQTRKEKKVDQEKSIDNTIEDSQHGDHIVEKIIATAIGKTSRITSQRQQDQVIKKVLILSQILVLAWRTWVIKSRWR